MTDSSIIPVVLSGGSGTRLWPLSRSGYPKQFLPLIGSASLFQMTLERVSRLKDTEPSLVISNEDHRFIIAEQAKQIDQKLSGIILEPIAKNTAPAIALAALHLIKLNKGDAVMLVLPSDHTIGSLGAFQAAVSTGTKLAQDGKLVTFGIFPGHPETGYGYIKSGENITENAFNVANFVEKPNLEKAQEYLVSGDYYWNSGMFMFTAANYIKELTQYQPKIVEACQKALELAKNDLDFIRVDATAFKKSPSDSVDYAVMEQTKDAAVVPLDADWDDVGAWPAVWKAGKKDADGNANRGDVLTSASKNNYVHADHRLVTMLGVEDLIVIETSDAVMVAHKDHAQDVKKIVETLKQQKRYEATAHRKIFRPWGTYDAIDKGPRFQVKRITVKPGQKLSLQLHHHRAEHWVVVSGTAKVQINDAVQFVPENESVFIPLGAKHSLENPGKLDLELIEVQTGSYLGEDDIVRFDDKYGRT
jgi:mannose-1-phosphate guanylyltransferase